MQGLKRTIMIIFAIVVLFSFVSCKEHGDNNSNGITVVATLFPQYDFARAILGEKGSAVLLLTPGADSHNFELTPSDIRTINNSDLFLYIGPDMEIWVDSVIGSINNKVKVISLSKEIGIEDNDAHDGHLHTTDPHIWTNPKNAIQMLGVVYNNICDIDPDNSDYYKANYETYLKALKEVDEDFFDISEKSNGACLYFSGKFAFRHFVEEYGFSYNAPFNSCSDVQIESLAAVNKLISDIKAEGIKYIFYEELSSSSILETIVSETGVTPLLLHSTHNVSKTEYDNGETYLSLMRGNVKNLRKALIDG